MCANVYRGEGQGRVAELGMSGGKGGIQSKKADLGLYHNGFCVFSDGVWGFIL